MKEFAIAIGLAAMLAWVCIPAVFPPLPVAHAAEKPSKPKDQRKAASACVVAAVGSGAYDTLSAPDLAAWCVEAVKAVYAAQWD